MPRFELWPWKHLRAGVEYGTRRVVLGAEVGSVNATTITDVGILPLAASKPGTCRPARLHAHQSASPRRLGAAAA